jgi:NAD(P)-dependent dehydrogenase (short-subunit alcohol dehydrogenase family)
MGGLGESISTKMHDAGYRVVVTYSPGNANADNWVTQMKARDYNFSAFPVDVADFDSCQQTMAKVQSQVGPSGRLGKPEEIAGLIIYLCSDEAAFVTGANIAINGGQHMQ